MNRKIAVIWLSLVLLFSFVVIVVEMPTLVKAGTVWVDDDYPTEDATHKKTIQAGVDAANPGDTVFVYNGTYYENVVVDKTINLTGEAMDTTIIDGSGSGDVVLITADWVNITGFSIVNGGTAGLDAGLQVDSDNNTIFNNYFSTKESGICLSFSKYNAVTGNIFSGNDAGISLRYSSENNIIDNLIMDSNCGIHFISSNGNTAINNNLSSNIQYGILTSYSSHNVIMNNDVLMNEEFGIYLRYSSETTISGNIMVEDGIFIFGDLLEHWNTHNIEDSNTVNGKPVYYWRNQTGGAVPLDAGEVILANCSNVTVTNQVISNGSAGIVLGFSLNNYLQRNIVSNSYRGIHLYSSFENEIVNNMVLNNKFGFSLWESSFNNVSCNNVSYNEDGFSLATSINNNIVSNNISKNGDGIRIYSANNKVTKNNVSNNGYGIFLAISSNNNLVTFNNVSNNGYGIYLWSSSNNWIYNNNIIVNTIQAYDDWGDSYWDNCYPLGGNYWSDYGGVDNLKGPNQDIPGSDGIGDTNYSIDSDSIDNYPLMEPYNYKPFENYTILKQGWNLISVPLIQEEKGLIKVLEMIDGWYDAVQWYDYTDSNDPWKHHKVSKPYGNDLSELNETMGFWIHITQPGDTIFLYNGTQPIENQTITLHEGWNLVGYPSLTNYNRTYGLNNLTFDTHVDAIWTYDAGSQTYKELSETDYFIIGKGYWMHSKVEIAWKVPV